MHRRWAIWPSTSSVCTGPETKSRADSAGSRAGQTTARISEGSPCWAREQTDLSEVCTVRLWEDRQKELLHSVGPGWNRGFSVYPLWLLCVERWCVCWSWNAVFSSGWLVCELSDWQQVCTGRFGYLWGRDANQREMQTSITSVFFQLVWNPGYCYAFLFVSHSGMGDIAKLAIQSMLWKINW